MSNKLRKFTCIGCGQIVEKRRPPHQDKLQYCSRQCYQDNQPSHSKIVEQERVALEKLNNES